MNTVMESFIKTHKFLDSSVRSKDDSLRQIYFTNYRYIRGVSEHLQTSRMACFVDIFNGSHSSTIFSKHSILDISQGSEYASDFYTIYLC